jgi:carbon storage regulator
VLIITRKAGERIMIGQDVVVQVMEASGGSARLGIEAPRSLPVYREEIWKALGEARPGPVPEPGEMPTRPAA